MYRWFAINAFSRICVRLHPRRGAAAARDDADRTARLYHHHHQRASFLPDPAAYAYYTTATRHATFYRDAANKQLANVIRYSAHLLLILSHRISSFHASTLLQHKLQPHTHTHPTHTTSCYTPRCTCALAHHTPT